MNRMTDLTGQNPFAQAEGQEAKKSRLLSMVFSRHGQGPEEQLTFIGKINQSFLREGRKKQTRSTLH